VDIKLPYCWLPDSPQFLGVNKDRDKNGDKDGDEDRGEDDSRIGSKYLFSCNKQITI
jgi:hypothetical protein